MDHASVDAWLEQLKVAWEGRDPEAALALFVKTERYYERPFVPGTTQEQFRSYWQDIVDLEDIRFEYQVLAVEGRTACVHWKNWFKAAGSGDETELDGVFAIVFDDAAHCVEFRQWWFMK